MKSAGISEVGSKFMGDSCAQCFNQRIKFYLFDLQIFVFFCSCEVLPRKFARHILHDLGVLGLVYPKASNAAEESR